MTRSEYRQLYNASRKQWASVNADAAKVIKTAYQEAAEAAAALVRDAETRQLSELTSGSWGAIEQQLRSGARAVSTATENATTTAISTAYMGTEAKPGMGIIDNRFLLDAFPEGLITAERLSTISFAVNRRVLQSMASRVVQDGYTFSDRVWGPAGIGQNYSDDIKNLILAGTAQGRDAVDIARDIEVYVAKGRDAVFTPGRYGTLEPGTAEYAARMHKTVDYRALRLVRSELYASMQTAALWQGQINPGCIGKWDWVLSAGHIDWGCACDSIARAGPYELNQVPGYQHTNCLCRIVPVLMPVKDFVADLASWANGGSVPYLEKWYNEIYLGFNTSY